MNIISWNCRGLGNLRTVRELHRMVKQKKPILVFLMETKLRHDRMEAIRRKLEFPNMLAVDCIGKSGGLALLWNEEVKLEIQNYSQRHINAVIRGPEGEAPWKFTGFYGQPDVAKRHEAWALMKHLAGLVPIPWVCIGDFNEITIQSEKWGGRGRANSQMVAFQQALDFCDLTDLGFIGPKFTWSNCRDNTDFTKVRLDRGVANNEWRDLFPLAEILVEVVPCSDHSPLVLSPTEVNRGRFGGTRFRYEEKWRMEEGFYEIMEDNWAAGSVREGNDWENFTSKLNLCRQELLRWQQRKREPMQKSIAALKKKLTKIQNSEDRGSGAEMQAVQKELQHLLDSEDMQWRQRAKSDWLRDGDRNTRYFHECANARRKTNRIHNILDAEERMCDTEEEVQMGFINYFSSLFTTVDAGDMGPCLQHMERRVSDDMNQELLKPFSEDDIRTALFQMAPLKAPGPDGFPAGFYQTN
jgi:exonuclease III